MDVFDQRLALLGGGDRGAVGAVRKLRAALVVVEKGHRAVSARDLRSVGCEIAQWVGCYRRVGTIRDPFRRRCGEQWRDQRARRPTRDTDVVPLPALDQVRGSQFAPASRNLMVTTVVAGSVRTVVVLRSSAPAIGG